MDSLNNIILHPITPVATAAAAETLPTGNTAQLVLQIATWILAALPTIKSIFSKKKTVK